MRLILLRGFWNFLVALSEMVAKIMPKLIKKFCIEE